MEKEASKRKRKSLDDLLLKKTKKNKNAKVVNEDDDLFMWEDYLKKCRSKAVPKSAFKHVDDSKTSGFTPGMKVEAKDQTSSTGTYWVATIVMVSGPLLLLRFDGYDRDRSGDFWCNASSPDLQPIGWCAKSNTILIPPEAIRHKETNWAKFLMMNLRDAVAAPDDLFHVKETESDDNELSIGTKLELQDSADPLCYWVATVVEKFGLRLQLRYEGVDNEHEDVWVYYLSDTVHNLGWGKKNGMTLEPPKDISSQFDWSKMIDDINNLPASDEKQTKSKLKKDDSLPPVHGFQSGMKLEAVNPNDPSSLCVATISRIINEYYFMVEIDDLLKAEGDRLLFWCHAKSRNIFPCGWCEKNKISVTPPPGYPTKPFTWDAYLKYCILAKAAPESLFYQDVPTSEFEIGFKLEAVDQTKRETISVATVKQVMGRTVWVQLDGYTSNVVEHIYDVTSYDLFPVGWCSMHGHPLLTPQTKKKGNTRLKSLRVTSQRLAKAGTAPPATSPSEAVSNQTSSSTPENSPTTETADGKLSKRKLTPLNTPLKEMKPASPASTESASTPTPPSTIPGGRTTCPNGGQPNAPGSPVQSMSDTIDLTEDDGNDRKGDDKDAKLCLHVRCTCSCGPYLDKKKLANLPKTIGPANANTVLRQLVEHIVLSSYSSKKVLKLLAAERDKKTFASILKTLTTKLSVCQNVFSLSKVTLCTACDTKQGKANTNTNKTLQNGTTSQQTKPNDPPKKVIHNKPSLKSPVRSGPGVSEEEEVIGKIPGNKHVSSWNVDEVVNFVDSRDCKKFADVFREQEVDGKALMLLSLEEIHKVLGVTLGPAIKLHDDVQKLRRKPK